MSHDIELDVGKNKLRIEYMEKSLDMLSKKIDFLPGELKNLINDRFLEHEKLEMELNVSMKKTLKEIEERMMRHEDDINKLKQYNAIEKGRNKILFVLFSFFAGIIASTIVPFLFSKLFE